MDINIIISSILGFIGFLILHFILSLLYKNKVQINWLIRLYLLIAVLLLSINFWFNNQLILLDNLQISFFSFIVFSLFVYIYIIGIWGVFESSIRLQLIRELAGFNQNQSPYVTLLEKFNDQQLIKKRIQRLVDSSEIVKSRQKYKLGKSLSYFLIHAKIQQLLMNWYRK